MGASPPIHTKPCTSAVGLTTDLMNEALWTAQSLKYEPEILKNASCKFNKVDLVLIYNQSRVREGTQ